MFEGRYKEAVGGLTWITNMSRLDISNAFREVARHAYDPTNRHWAAVLNILHYLKVTKELGITFGRDAPDNFRPLWIHHTPSIIIVDDRLPAVC